MLEIQKARIYERSRLKAKGATDDEIERVQHLPFRPAFVDGRRRQQETDAFKDGGQVPAEQFAFRRER